MNNILITSVGRRVSLVKAFKSELKKIIPSAKVIVIDSDIELSGAAQVADEAFKIVKVAHKSYIDNLLEICIERGVKLVIPTLDTELTVLSKHIDKFKAHQIEILISDEKFIEICNDKAKSQKLFEKLEINVITLYSKENFQLPLFIKPKSGSNSKENYIIKDQDQLSKYHFNNEELLFFEFFDPDIYDEYTCDLYYNKNGVLKCVIPRKRIEIRGGEVSKSVTKKNKLVDCVVENMSNIEGVRGCITTQFFLHKETEQVTGIEINPRFGGGFPLSYMAGGNFPKWIIQEYFLNEEIPYFEDWEKNLLMLRHDNEILVHDHKD
ncbi:ATP-grasp domain-containing protein [Flavivirga sp. 57AJ16]|uniref:ATP-grasp domain-containing protein n=1 Tax=Flavivirga sp. 57AJ16 TaxID=3025307 RepID=UPI002366C549|nr:ATP-grasp domain-containing protein [Flavivirga sp. 57AJ16]MDD7887612.1 ATP-grasp domain-containing protein [Flavivirga sp. 57AJ16]